MKTTPNEQDELCVRLTEIINLSEERFERTNETIDELSSAVMNNVKMVEHLTNVYVTQLNKMQECRDVALRELSRVNDMMQRKDETIFMLMSILRDKNSTQINVN